MINLCDLEFHVTAKRFPIASDSSYSLKFTTLTAVSIHRYKFDSERVCQQNFLRDFTNVSTVLLVMWVTFAKFSQKFIVNYQKFSDL